MAITYNAGTNIITVTGYTEGTPCTFLDIYNADVAGGWGVVTRQCTNLYCISAILIIGDGSLATWFADTQQQVIFTATIAALQGHVRVRINAHFRIGKIKDAAKKTTENGCYLATKTASNHPCIFGVYNNWAYGHNIEIYSSKVDSRNAITAGWARQVGVTLTNIKIQNSILNGTLNMIDGIDCYNLQTEGHDTLRVSIFEKVKGTINLEGLNAHNLVRSFVTTSLSTADMVVKNVTLKNCDYVARCDQNSYDLYLINTVSDLWAFGYLTYTGKIYRQYEFDLKVQDKDGNGINGATVKIWDKDNSLVVDTTTAGGTIATQTLNYGYYNEVGGDTPVMQTPHKIQIRKAGTNYLTYETDFTINKKMGWVIMMVDMSDLIDEINENEVKIDEGFENVKVRIDDLEVFGIPKQ